MNRPSSSTDQSIQDSMASALAAMKANRPLLVEEICRNFLDLKPGNVEHLRLLGLALMKQKRLAEAEDRFRFALKLKPDYPQLYADLGSVLATQGKLSDAIACFQSEWTVAENVVHHTKQYPSYIILPVVD